VSGVLIFHDCLKLPAADQCKQRHHTCKIVGLPSGRMSNSSCNNFLSLTGKLPTSSDPVIFVQIESDSLCDVYSVYR
jgi:hypothetical protein